MRPARAGSWPALSRARAERVSADTDTEFGNNEIFGDSQIGETKSQTDLKEADGVRDQAGWAAQGTKKTSAASTAAEDAKSGWGRVISDAIFGGVQEGAESAASAFGGKAADHAAAEIFDDDRGRGRGRRRGGVGRGRGRRAGGRRVVGLEQVGGQGRRKTRPMARVPARATRQEDDVDEEG